MKFLQEANCYWITGLSGSGKTSMVNLLSKYITSHQKPVLKLDGDELRNIFGSISYSSEERLRNGYRFSSLCNLVVEQKINVVIGVMGLFHELRNWNKINIKNYIEIYLDTPISELIKRDPKGLYKKAIDGEINDVAGVNMEVELPNNPDIHIKWNKSKSVDDTFNEILKNLNFL